MEHLPGFEMGGHLLLRVNPVPAVRIRSADDVASDFDALHRARATAAELADELSVLLFDAVGRAEPAQRGPLLQLRRDVHNARTPRVDCRDQLPEPTARLVGAWMDAHDQAKAAAARIVHRDAEDVLAERRRLQALLAHPTLMQSLALSSAWLPASAERYRSTDPAALPKRARGAEESLLRYAARATGKTSPFSRYTISGFGRLAKLDADTAVDMRLATGFRSALSLNQFHLRRLERSALRRPQARLAHPVRPNPSLVVDGDTIRFTLDRDDLPADRSALGRDNGEVDFAVSASPALRWVLAWYRQRGGEPALVADLAGEFARAVGGDMTRATQFIERLLDSGVLRPLPVVAEQDPYGAERLCDWLCGSADDAVAGAGKHLRDSLTMLSGFAEADGAGRAERRRELESSIAAALDALGEPMVPGPVLFEDCALVEPVRLNADLFGPLLADGARVLDTLQAFDEQLVFSRLLRNSFVARVGVGGRSTDPGLLMDVCEPIFEQSLRVTEGVGDELVQSDPVLAELEQVRAEILDDVVRRVLHDSGPVAVDLAWASEVSRRLPAWCAAAPASHAMFVQPIVRAGEPVAGVVNKIYNGWGNYLSRFLATADPASLDSVRRAVRRHIPAGDLIAEIRPVRGFNANIHPLIADRDLDLDGVLGPDAIPVSDVAAEHDPVTDRVVLRHLPSGRRIHPLYLGFLIPYYLPRRAVPLAALGGNGAIIFEPQVTADRRRLAADPARAGTVRHYPPIVAGRLMLARERWHLPASAVPRKDPAESNGEYFVRLNMWRRQHAMPDEVYLHPPAPEFRSGQTDSYFAAYLGNRKPQLVDFLSRLHVRHIGRLLDEQPGTAIVIEAAVPDGSGNLPVESHRHAAEIVVEYYRSGRDR